MWSRRSLDDPQRSKDDQESRHSKGKAQGCFDFESPGKEFDGSAGQASTGPLMAIGDRINRVRLPAPSSSRTTSLRNPVMHRQRSVVWRLTH